MELPSALTVLFSTVPPVTFSREPGSQLMVLTVALEAVVSVFT